MSGEGKPAAIDLIRSAYREIASLFGSLTDEQLDRPIFTGEGAGWRVRDLIAHYAYWQTLAARCAEKMATGPLPVPEERIRLYLGIPEELDEMNDANFMAWRERGTDEALAELAAANARLIAAIDALPADAVTTGDGPEDFHRYFWQPGVNHLRQHREHIDAALRGARTS